MAKIDVTNKIEQLEVFEERLGVTISSLSAFVDDDGTDSIPVEVMGELQARSGAEIPENLELIMAVYDTSGRVIGNASDFINSDDFFGLETFQMNTYIPINSISKIRIYPKKR